MKTIMNSNTGDIGRVSDEDAELVAAPLLEYQVTKEQGQRVWFFVPKNIWKMQRKAKELNNAERNKGIEKDH